MNLADEKSIVAQLSEPVRPQGKEPSALVKKSGKSFAVVTEGSSKASETFEVKYSFGFSPLQQYLVESADGRLAPLRLSWDSRSKSEGGQRWMHLYAEQEIPPGDLLHWTGPNQNYNGMCADCHSTNLRRGYDPKTDRFETTWSEINVSCEACHGPASEHLKWAEGGAPKTQKDRGFHHQLRGASASSWRMGSGGIASRTPGAESATEIDTCAPCHSRRALLKEDPVPHRDVLDLISPVFATAPLYHPDGQIDDELYVWGSFLQSKMHAAGVTCSNCHNPHSGQLRADGNALCGQCHDAKKYDRKQHHFHEEGAGTSCIGCHMPTKTYMEVDERHDHSFRIPRPEMTLSHGVPNACSSCHQDKDAKWAAAAYVKNWGKPAPLVATWMARGSSGDPAAGEQLLRIARDKKVPVMQRATALVIAAELPGLGREVTEAVSVLKASPLSLMRLAAVQSARAIPAPERVSTLLVLLKDSVFAIRVEAVRQLLTELPPQAYRKSATEVKKVAEEYIAAQQPFLDRAAVRSSLAAIELGLGRTAAAVRHFQAGLKLEPQNVGLVINYADFLRQQGKDQQALSLLEELLEQVPDAGPAWHAKGLVLVRLKKKEEALEPLKRAAELVPGDPQYAVAYGLALHERGDKKAAFAVFGRALEESPFARTLHLIRVQLLIKEGKSPELSDAVQQWLQRLPNDPQAQQFSQQL